MVLVTLGMIAGDDDADALPRLVIEMLPFHLQHDLPHFLAGAGGRDPLAGEHAGVVADTGIKVFQAHID